MTIALVHSLIEEIVELPAVNAKRLSAVIGLSLSLDRESPYGLFYKGAGSGRLQRVSLTLSKTNPSWSVELEFNTDNPCSENELELSRYGGIPEIAGVYPEAYTEGVVAYRCKHRGFSVVFAFTSETRRLVWVTISRPQTDKS